MLASAPTHRPPRPRVSRGLRTDLPPVHLGSSLTLPGELLHFNKPPRVEGVTKTVFVFYGVVHLA